MGWATRHALAGARDAAEARARARAYFERGLPAAGNGTVMQAAPIALAARSVEEAERAARADAVLTHGDPRAGGLLDDAGRGDPLPAADRGGRERPSRR